MYRGTTILSVKHKGKVALGGDGQVTLDITIMKHKANKVRQMAEGKVLAGFAGAAADAFTLFEKFERKLEQYSNNLYRAAVELAKEWRTDRVLRRLEASMVIVDKEHSLLVSGNGDVIEPDDGILSIGSGSPYAMAAARALMKHSQLSAKKIVEQSLFITASICIYTNDQIVVEEL